MTKQYGFTSEGVRTFCDDIIGDVMEALDETGAYEDAIYITVGSRTITVPMVAEAYESVENMLRDSVAIWEEEYTIGGKDNA